MGFDNRPPNSKSDDTHVASLFHRKDFGSQQNPQPHCSENHRRKAELPWSGTNNCPPPHLEKRHPCESETSQIMICPWQGSQACPPGPSRIPKLAYAILLDALGQKSLWTDAQLPLRTWNPEFSYHEQPWCGCWSSRTINLEDPTSETICTSCARETVEQWRVRARACVRATEVSPPTVLPASAGGTQNWVAAAQDIW